jgi:hypothetical protein
MKMVVVGSDIASPRNDLVGVKRNHPCFTDPIFAHRTAAFSVAVKTGSVGTFAAT